VASWVHGKWKGVLVVLFAISVVLVGLGLYALAVTETVENIRDSHCIGGSSTVPSEFSIWQEQSFCGEWYIERETVTTYPHMWLGFQLLVLAAPMFVVTGFFLFQEDPQ
jgi:hypothetical protein